MQEQQEKEKKVYITVMIKLLKFNKKAIGMSTNMLFLAVIGLCIPAIFMHSIDSKLISTL